MLCDSVFLAFTSGTLLVFVISHQYHGLRNDNSAFIDLAYRPTFDIKTEVTPRVMFLGNSMSKRCREVTASTKRRPPVF